MKQQQDKPQLIAVKGRINDETVIIKHLGEVLYLPVIEVNGLLSYKVGENVYTLPDTFQNTRH
jgi:hypothetical protein